MKYIIFISPFILSSCLERCIPFENWKNAVEKSLAEFEECIQPNIRCEERKKVDKKFRCIWNNCPLTEPDGRLASMAGYPGRKLVCENDCGLSILNFCIYPGRQNADQAAPEFARVLKELEKFQ